MAWAVLLALFLVLLAHPTHATAQATGGAVDSVAHLRHLFQQITAGIDAFAAGNAGLAEVGRRTAVTLFGVILVWGTVRSWVLGQGMAQLLPDLIQPVVILGLTLWAVNHLGPTVKASIEAIGTIIASTMGLPAGPPTEVDVIHRMAEAGFHLVAGAPRMAGSSGWAGLMAAVADQALSFVVRFVAALVLLVAGGIAAGVMMMAKVQTALAILFAPVLVPWAMWKPSAFLFNAWLGFLIAGAMQGVMAAAVASLSIQVIDQVVIVAQSTTAGQVTSMVTCCVILLMAFLIGFLFTKVPSLASGLVGGPTLDLHGWSAVGKATLGGGSTVAGAAGSVASVGARTAKGGWEGYVKARHGGDGGGASHGAAVPLPGRAAGAPRPSSSGRGLGVGTGGGTVDRPQPLPPRPAAQGAVVAPGPALAPVEGLTGAGQTPHTPGLAAAVGRVVGTGAGRAVTAVVGAVAPPTLTGATSPPPAAPNPDAAAKPLHQPFRPKPGARPVNRPAQPKERP